MILFTDLPSNSFKILPKEAYRCLRLH
jgi:hypothetical protein